MPALKGRRLVGGGSTPAPASESQNREKGDPDANMR